jgi:hypothetical protein
MADWIMTIHGHKLHDSKGEDAEALLHAIVDVLRTKGQAVTSAEFTSETEEYDDWQYQ